LSNQRSESRNAAPGEKLRRHRKEKIGVVVACFVGNDCEHTLARLDYVQRLVNQTSENRWVETTG
jgi:hypothetical protein